MEVSNARGVINNLDYHVYHYLRPAQPLCLGNLVLVCRKDGCDAVEPTIYLEIITHVFEVRGPDIENRFITHEHLDEELASQHEM